ncbi:conserved hypothetical protein [Leishmania mexicana MHOM/GT/2001/U1103]|uniref:Uncharacterized protein n=1 Tax=Leishmania mexicana (strain MHOM/GT/2001/U1103) TaxID=929439 RepID=E9AYG3_LEIMU|nr:conserved hypothetical protein [Leishmania mexicana MHOM/GT/2001/U1103]CBZ28005.1 conserved hypothetical protein [Leishmania mexicana MHOM/GT/2001/U1103]
MFRWTAGTKARADLASRQHGYPGGPARLLLARRRPPLHPHSSDTVTASGAAAGAGSTVATASQSSAHSGTERAHSSPAVLPSAPLARDDAAAGTAVVRDGAAFGTVVEEAAQTGVCPPSTTTDTSSPLLDAPVSEVVAEGDGECGNTRQSTAADVASSPCPAPSLSRLCTAAPPSPSSPLPSPPLHVVANHGGNLSEHPSSASSSHRFKVFLARQQPPLPPPPLPSSSHSSSTVHAEALVEALEAKAARQRRRGHTLGRSSRHQREWRQRHKSHRLGENPDDSSRGTDAMAESSEEEVADTYAKVQQQQRQRQRTEKQAEWESWPSSSIDDSSDPYVHRRDRVAQCEEQQRRPHSRPRVAEQSVDCIAVQLPLQRAKEAPASATTHITVISPSNAAAHPRAPSSSLACSERREALKRFAQEDGHPLPGGMVIEVAADTFHRDSCSNAFATGAKVNFSSGVVGRPLHPFESSPGCRDGDVSTCNVEKEGILPWHVSPLTSTVGLHTKCPEHEVTPIFEDQPLSWYPQPQAQATQHVLDEYASAAGGVVRVEGDNHLRFGVASLLGPDWSVAEPASTLAATPVGAGETDLWVPGAGSLSFTPWRHLGSDCGTCVGVYGLPADRAMAPRRGLALGLGDTPSRFYGGTPQGPSWWLSSAEPDCRDAEDGSGWPYRTGRCPTSLTLLRATSALPGSRDISTAPPPLAGLFSSHAVPRKSPTTPAFPWMPAGEGEGGAGVSRRSGDGDGIFSERAPSSCLPHYSLGRAMGSFCGHDDGDGGDSSLYPAQAPPPRSHHGSYAPQPPSHSPPFFGLPTFSSVASASSNTIAAAAPAPYRVSRAARQRRRQSNGARPPRALNGTTERCRRFWERCRQSNAPN